MAQDRKYGTKGTNYRPGTGLRHPSSLHQGRKTGEIGQTFATHKDIKMRELEILKRKLKDKLAKGLPSTR